ncbi:nuclear transport factor 2 family protein [Bacillus sp. sid0103]|uniref:nuclear transport factor 2 family protein n=1 Tax=Bacillus sp. sid0103 TaxID=2856337 RepID=UPI001C449C59|nr:nuclear transport factor 2 family protein [Bacillus sp. sid0103]MBV7508665.1 nuclear transport factor 2 family protein [Bacillus sp. sid0103]
MEITQKSMTDEQRKSVALEYFKLADQGNPAFLELFAEDAQLYFPKMGIANGIEDIKKLVFDGPSFKSITHDYAYFNYIIQGDTVVVEGTSSGVTSNGKEWRAGVTHAGRFCNVFEIRDYKIHRLFIYLDPDYEK